MTNCEEMEDRRPTIVDNIVIGATKEVRTKSISKIILDSLTETPDFIGQINADTGETISFGELKDRSIRCALWLRKQGIGEGDMVNVPITIQTNDCIPILACFYVGATLVPLRHDGSLDKIRHILEHTKPKIIFAEGKLVDGLNHITADMGIQSQFVTFEKYGEYSSLDEIMNSQDKIEVLRFEPTEPKNPSKQAGVIVFSSGTSGIAKGTMLAYDWLSNLRITVTGITGGMKVLWYLPWSWVCAIEALVPCIEFKATRIIHGKFDPEETYRVMKDHQVNHIILTPFRLGKIFNVERDYLPSLRRVITLGAPASLSLLEKVRKCLPNVSVWNCYGMTEAGGAIAIQTEHCRIVDSVGEICINVNYKSIGYIDNEEEAKKLIDKEGWLHTGDVGFYDETGELKIIDKMKLFIDCGEKRLPSTRIENILMQHPEVVNASVVSVPHEIDIQRPFAFVQLSPGAKVTKEELIELPARVRENPRITGGLVFVEDFPVLPNGKIDIQELKKRAGMYDSQ
ncbi:hypothetical protein QAD02_001347 [Eretmocerus hayati]|uniref:Uncharacterized protein n=1 Tax=Eretmocerus hayati TaxID=131215 RepID=A0ACC2NFZ2_9HYME|nr:hypothetical protein QAD02_001347 [Eretmocerus hayati]